MTSVRSQLTIHLQIPCKFQTYFPKHPRRRQWPLGTNRQEWVTKECTWPTKASSTMSSDSFFDFSIFFFGIYLMEICRGNPSTELSFTYCITGIFPGTFISRKMMISTFFHFLFSRQAHGCTDTKFSANATKRFGSWTFIADDRLCAECVCAEQKSQSYASLIKLARRLYCSVH